MKRTREHPRWASALAAGALVALVVCGLHALQTFRIFEYKLHDLRMRWTLPEKGGHPDVVIVAYTEDSLGALRVDENKDWRDREWMGLFFKGLSGKPSRKFPEKAPGAARPSAVLYDFFTLCDPSEPPENLLQELRENRSLYLAVPFSNTKKTHEYAPPEYLDRFAIRVENDGSVAPPEYAAVVLPTNDICGEKDDEGTPLGYLHGIADVRAHSDSDGVDRRYHLFCLFRGRFFPSFALAAILEREKTREISIRNRVLTVGSRSIPVDDEGAILMRYYHPVSTYKTYGAYEIMTGRRAYDNKGEAQRYDPKNFENKIVIVGATAAGLLDLRVTPVSGVMPGMEIHAVAISNVLNEDYLRRPAAAWSYVLIVAVALLTAFMTRYSPALRGLGFSLILTGAYGGVAVWLFHGRWVIDMAPQIVAVALGYAVTSMANFLYEGLQKRRVKKILQEHVSAGVAEKLLKNMEEKTFEGEKKLLTVFFMDFAGFTTLSEKLDPQELVRLINQYHETAANEIYKQDGTIDKFIGDCIMAFWGDPIDQPDHTIRAVRAAISLQERLHALAEELRKHDLPDVKARVGINTGVVVVGNVGSKDRHNYTAMGNDVNLASRLEGVNKEFGTDIIISDSTYAGAREMVEVRELANIKVKGKTQAVRIFEVLGEKGRVDPERLAKARRFEEGLRLLRERKWDQARPHFDGVDHASKLYAALCDEYAAHPPAADWDGAYVMEHK